MMLILYRFSLDLPPRELFRSAHLSPELISAAASSICIVLAVSLTVLITPRAWDGKKPD